MGRINKSHSPAAFGPVPVCNGLCWIERESFFGARSFGLEALGLRAGQKDEPLDEAERRRRARKGARKAHFMARLCVRRPTSCSSCTSCESFASSVRLSVELSVQSKRRDISQVNCLTWSTKMRRNAISSSQSATCSQSQSWALTQTDRRRHR